MQMRIDGETAVAIKVLADSRHVPMSWMARNLVSDFVVRGYLSASRALSKTQALIEKAKRFPEMANELQELYSWQDEHASELAFFAPLVSGLGLSPAAAKELVE